MKHHVNIIFLGLLLNLCYGIPRGPTTPTFSLSEERSFDGSPKINVVFANGKSDTMILTKFDNGEEEEPPTSVEDKIETEEEIEDCRYLGHLENEPSACIAMVGCPGVETVEFTIFSKNVFDSPAYVWTKEGSVEMVEIESSHSEDDDDDDVRRRRRPTTTTSDDDDVRRRRRPTTTTSDDDDVPPEPVADNTTYVPASIEEDRDYESNSKWEGDDYCDDGNNNPEYNFDGGDCCVEEYIKNGKDGKYCTECRCKTMKLDLKVGYGKGFKDNSKRQGRNDVETIKYIKNVMFLAKPYFCDESLGHRIELSYPQPKYYEDYNFRANHDCETDQNSGSATCDRAKVYKLVEEELGEADLMVFLGYDETDFDSDGSYRGGATTGNAAKYQVCREKKYYKKFSINEETNRNASKLAGTIAHELGHLLGMEHDHKDVHEGKGCDGKGIMSYGKNRPVAWSTCSKNDFIKQYDRQKDNWCMDPLTTNFCAKECKDVQSDTWISKNYEDTYGNMCEKQVGPKNYCEVAKFYCDGKKCKEFCKKTCNNC